MHCWGEAAASTRTQRSELCPSPEQSAEAAGSGAGRCARWAPVTIDSRACAAVGTGDFNLASAGSSGQEAAVTRPSCADKPAVTELPRQAGPRVVLPAGWAAGPARRACGCWSGCSVPGDSGGSRRSIRERKPERLLCGVWGGVQGHPP